MFSGLYKPFVFVFVNHLLILFFGSNIYNQNPPWLSKVHFVFLITRKQILSECEKSVSCRLDVGEGKDLDLVECPRSKLKQQCIRYLGPVRAILFLSIIYLTYFGYFSCESFLIISKRGKSMSMRSLKGRLFTS